MNRENRMRRLKKRLRYQARRDQRRAAAAHPDWNIPPLDRRHDQYAPHELDAINSYPAMTGLGCHPRFFSDEDWVASAIMVKDNYSNAEFWTQFLGLLRRSFPEWDPRKGVPANAGPMPTSDSGRVIPQKNVEHYFGGKWTTPTILGASLNPVLTGVGFYQRMIPDEKWINTVISLEERGEMEEDQMLVNILWLLKQSFGEPGRPEIMTPFGYQKIDKE